MSLIATCRALPLVLLMAASPAHAGGTAIWLAGTPDPTVTPGLAPLTARAALPAIAWGSEDDNARQALLTALEESRPLLDVFDGELRIMRKLQGALGAVRLIRPEDRDLVWRARLLQGLAVHRYFQDDLATDPAAAEFAIKVGERVEVRPWRNAIALDPDREPTEAELPDQAARLAYQEARARMLLDRPLKVSFAELPADATTSVDGRRVELGTLQLPPGDHSITVEREGTIVALFRVQGEDGSVDLTVPATAAGLEALAEPLRESRGGLPLPTSVQAALAGVEGPVMLVVPGKKEALRFEVRNGAALKLADADEDTSDRPGPTLRAAIAGAWIYDGDYLLQNADEGAPATAGTVNGAAPVVALAGELPLGPVVLGAGADLVLPVGSWQSLPSGDAEVRLRAYPHLQVGIRQLRATAGFWTPWHVGLGARGHLDLTDTIGISGAYIHGLGVPLGRGEGEPDFTPASSRLGWLGVHARWP